MHKVYNIERLLFPPRSERSDACVRRGPDPPLTSTRVLAFPARSLKLSPWSFAERTLPVDPEASVLVPPFL